MNPILKNILAIITGVIVVGALNMAIINLSDSIIAPPPGADLKTTEGLKAAMHLFEPKHFLMPFLAHALGTFLGAFLTASIAATHKMKLAIAIGAWNMLGGIMMIVMLPSPLWFTLVDLILAYIPMAYLGAKLTIKK